jgi:hypothetical protein
VTDLLTVVIAFAAGWSSALAWRAAGDRDDPRSVSVPGLAIALTHPSVPRPPMYDWAVEIPELVGPSPVGECRVGPGRLGRRWTR